MELTRGEITCDGCAIKLVDDGVALTDFRSRTGAKAPHLRYIDLCMNCDGQLFSDGIFMGWRLDSEHEKGEVI